jgi:hypothetical protein
MPLIHTPSVRRPSVAAAVLVLCVGLLTMLAPPRAHASASPGLEDWFFVKAGWGITFKNTPKPGL